MITYTPSLELFKKKAREGNLIPVYREILADMETPVTAFLKIDQGEYSYLLESVEGGEKWGRYCFLGGSPSIVFTSRGRKIVITRDGITEEREAEKDPLESLKDIMSEYKPVDVEGLPRFYGGAVGYVGYDMVRFFEKLPQNAVDDMDIPDAVFIITDSILIFDNISKKIKVVANIITSDGDIEGAYNRGTEKIERIIDRLNTPLTRSAANNKPKMSGKALNICSNMQEDKFKKGVMRCKEYIREGDIFQVVLSQRIEAGFDVAPFDIYRALRTINPSPYMYYLKLGDMRVIGSSPEVLVRVEGDSVELRPIAGTRPRGKTEEEDQRLEKELLKDPKERAEHIMLVDLGRNDLGRVSCSGSVEVNDLMLIERYSHVMHIVSNVRARLNKGLACYDVFRACFPAGTLSGAPKIRAMEIIDEIEPSRRGIYGGAVGYFGFSGNMDMAIAIRTLFVRGNTAYLGVGAGIVADSNPDKEFTETINKGKPLLKAIEIAEKGL